MLVVFMEDFLNVFEEVLLVMGVDVVIFEVMRSDGYVTFES